MKAPQTEIIDSVGTEHFNGSVTTAGVPVSITPTKTADQWLIQNPSVGPYSNSRTDYLRVSFDGGSTWFTVSYGAMVGWPGRALNNTLKVDANANGVKYEILSAVESYSE